MWDEAKLANAVAEEAAAAAGLCLNTVSGQWGIAPEGGPPS